LIKRKVTLEQVAEVAIMIVNVDDLARRMQELIIGSGHR
jgi:hypothetical protein